MCTVLVDTLAASQPVERVSKSRRRPGAGSHEGRAHGAVITISAR